MKAKNATRRMHVAEPNKKIWGAAATLMVILILGAFVGAAAADAAPAQADSARWKAVGEYYAARYEASAAASTARYEAMAKFFTGSGGDMLAENPELSFAHNFSQAVGGDFSGAFLAANPELNAARGSYNPAGVLAANPELSFTRNFSQAIGGDFSGAFLAANPELTFARGSYDRGYLSCSLNGDELVANPELAFFQQAGAC